MITNISTTDFRVQMGKTSNEHTNYKYVISNRLRTKLIDAELIEVKTYNLDGVYVELTPFSENRLLLVSNAAPVEGNTQEDIVLVEPKTINGQANNFTKFLSPRFKDDGILILSEHNIPLAEFVTTRNHLFILFNLFGEYKQENINIFEYIIEKVNELVYKPRQIRYSWKHTSDKGLLTDELKKSLAAKHEATIMRDREQLRGFEEDRRYYTTQIKTLTDKINQKRRLLTTEEAHLGSLDKSFFKDLDNIITHPKITDLKIKNGKYIIQTVPLRIYADNGRIYQAGAFEIIIDVERVSIRFNSNLRKKGYFSNSDPHPHVNGEDGNPCLGNLSTTVAELCSQNEIYALTIMLIDYLETANTSDAAGEKVTRWDEIDENGNIIEYGDNGEEEYEYTCDYCNEGCNERYTVYEEIYENDDGEWEYDGEHYVCEWCRDNNYIYHEETEDYYRRQ